MLHMWSNNLLQLTTTTTKIILTLTHLRFDFLNWLISTLYFHFSCSFPFASFTFVFKLSPAAALATYTCSPYFLSFTVRAGRGIPMYVCNFACQTEILDQTCVTDLKWTDRRCVVHLVVVVAFHRLVSN